MIQATIPYVEELPTNTIGFMEAQSILENKGKRINIDRHNWATRFPYAPQVSVWVAYNKAGLYLSYVYDGLSLRALSPGDGNYVHEDSCVEFFMQKEEGASYTNFEFNVAGVCYAAFHQTRKQSRVFTPDEYARILRYTPLEGQIIPEQHGVHVWKLTVMIPWDLMGYDTIPQKFYANFYNCADGTSDPHYMSWSPIPLDKPNFHCPQYFGEIILQ
ncbi:carbohydrate-binding family 9-like protein [Porphyromonas pogonae]|uniref:carbohydrate-binding family 9-like protein n=1 Tax=Porphyromonas pogonae TaxID=867595 RepID=UPI002E7740E7|nr:carbohydrate-binding family 9-like protein [Porphyromonas pogonae]